jgi:hypothetical protein
MLFLFFLKSKDGLMILKLAKIIAKKSKLQINKKTLQKINGCITYWIIKV